MGSTGSERRPETLVTMKLVIASEEPTDQVNTAGASAARQLLRRYLPILVLAALAALIPYFFPYDSISDVPRRVVVTYYGLLAVVAGLFGIIWILRTARLVVSPEGEADINLNEDARRKLLEVLHSTTRGNVR
jgi:hypothetical protein